MISCCVIARITATAYRDFRWPKLDRFNWALDYFDVMARGNTQPALWLVDEDAGETKLSFAELSERSDRVANALRRLGVRRGDRILVMLGNVVPLWETMLAAMKLGAVIVPATTLLTRNDLADRFARGRVKHVIAGADAAAKFADLPGDYTRIVVGTPPPGWISYETAYQASAEFTPDGERGRTIRCCSISPPAPRRRRSWSCTATRAIRSAICRRCTG